MEKISYKDWRNCYRLTNGHWELVAVADIGPRIIRVGRPGGPNILGEVPGAGEGEWKLYGGHRLWHAPEALPRSYAPDNKPVKVDLSDDRIRLTCETEPETGIQKQMEISLRVDDKCATLVHKLTNHGPWPVQLAAWALTVLTKEGFSFAPFPTGDVKGLLPCGVLTIWPYVNWKDPRLTIAGKHVIIHQNPKLSRRLKVGMSSTEGWAGYWIGGDLFIKRFDPIPEAAYPDFGCAMELFANDLIAEVESVGPLTHLEPGESLKHVERWYVFSGVDFDGTEESLEKNILPHVHGTT
jgi:hypothetical protein